MAAFMAVILAAIPNAFLAVVGKLVTEQFLQKIIERVLIAGTRKAATMTTNTLDDELAAEVENRLTTGGGK